MNNILLALKPFILKYKIPLIILSTFLLTSTLFLIFKPEEKIKETIDKGGELIENITEENDSETGKGSDRESIWQKDCESDERVSMKNLPMNLSDVGTIIPQGMVVGGHVTPIDHLYFSPIIFNSPRDKYPVFAMADGYIVEIGTREMVVGTKEKRAIEYRIIMQHSCQTISYFDLVTSLDDSILSQVPNIDTTKFASDIRIPIKAGQEIGRIGGQTLDTAIYNMDLTLPGLLTPSMYGSEFWKVHTDDFITYFPENLQKEMNSINLRKFKPYSGKIDYDIPGKLVGSWFEKGTNGYGGIQGEGYNAYWSGHLHIGFDAIMPENIWISIGDFAGSARHFYVKGNTPNPEKVGVSDGIVKYQLIEPANFMSLEQVANYKRSEGQVLGVILLQVLPDEELKVEIFPNKVGSAVSGFTSKAKVYER
ncbi:hypothetical protein HYV12_03135 [Candidatus Dojkabacteria bacterium]|nr:hypothetical protein [Candidatus Dojkabacteria bacterium]